MDNSTSNELTQAELKDLITYNPETGIATWKTPTSNRVRKDRPASYTNQGYVFLRINNKLYGVHRLAFLYMSGVIPAEVDHIDGNRANNAWNNLRSVTRAENNRNRRRQYNNTSGTTGVIWDRNRNKWRASIKLNGKTKYLGRFSTKEAAAAARQRAQKNLGFSDRHGL